MIRKLFCHTIKIVFVGSTYKWNIRRRNEKIISLAMAGIILCTSFFAVADVNVNDLSKERLNETYIDGEVESNDESVDFSDSNINIDLINANSLASAKGFILKTILRGLYKVAGEVSINKTEGSVIDYGSYLKISHKSIDLGDHGYQIKKKINGIGQDRVEAYAFRNNPFALFNQIIISLEVNDIILVSDKVIPGEVVGKTIPGFGEKKIEVEWADEQAGTWTPVVNYHFQNNYNGGANVPNSQVVTNDIQNELIIEDDYIYVVPSNDFISKKGNGLDETLTENNNFGSFSKNHQNLTVDELYYQFYDTYSQIIVNDLKDYIIGDTIYIYDIIEEISYDSKEDRTTFRFASSVGSNNEHSISFKNDLTVDYSKGEMINLKFEVVPIHVNSGSQLLDIDYNVYARTNHCPPYINDYIYNENTYDN